MLALFCAVMIVTEAIAAAAGYRPQAANSAG
jgi:hypothetical protein